MLPTRLPQPNRVIMKLRKVYPSILIISTLIFISVSLSGCTTLIQGLFGDTTDLTDLKKADLLPAVWTLIKWFIGLGTTIGTIFLIISGIMYMTALGDKEGMEKAKRGLLWSVIGVLVLIVSYVVVGYLFNTFLLSPASKIPINI